MNRADYQDAKTKFLDAVRRKDYESAWAIRRLMIAFYNKENCNG